LWILLGNLHCLTSVLMVLGVSVASAQTATPLDEGSLGYRIEIGRHERLVKARAPRNVKLARRYADEQLRQCVIRSGNGRASVLMTDYGLSAGQASALYRSIADVMYRAVRVGGVPCSGLSWRWGFGWPQCN
jgi:hypothetical protein